MILGRGPGKSKSCNLKSNWGGAREADWDRLLSGCRGECFDRGFESRPPRQKNMTHPELKVQDASSRCNITIISSPPAPFPNLGKGEQVLMGDFGQQAVQNPLSSILLAPCQGAGVKCKSESHKD